MSIPSTARPERWSAATIRPGPQPMSITGDSQRETTMASTASAGRSHRCRPSTKSCDVRPAGTDPSALDPTALDPTGPDPTGPEPTGPDVSGDVRLWTGW